MNVHQRDPVVSSRTERGIRASRSVVGLRAHFRVSSDVIVPAVAGLCNYECTGPDVNHIMGQLRLDSSVSETEAL